MSEWAAFAHAKDPLYRIQNYESLWTINKNKIRFDNGRLWTQWNGKYEIAGDEVASVHVTSFERYWGDETTVRIKITDFKYPVTGYKAAGFFTTFTLPEAITDHFDSTAYIDQYGYEIPLYKSEKIRSMNPRMTYTFETIYDTQNQKSGSNKPKDTGNDPITTIDATTTFKIKNIDKINNFNPSTDTLEIDTESFGMDGSTTFASGVNKKAFKKQLAKQDFDFLYDQKKGGLYFNENCADKGFGDGGISAILKGAPDLSESNLSFL